ncbi:GPR endopeptidase [Bacillus subtilis]|uniref:GPR endopeptidase n=1 Tax=Bacillus subtilis TaxID=1423 RepID=UPI002575F8A5|nr:GPR endopeptidase [Bacillus subtilis]
MLSEEDLADEKERESLLGIVGRVEEDEKGEVIEEVVSGLGEKLMVRAKEVD